MYRYKNILVGLDLSEKDPSIIRYAALVAKMAGTQEIRFLHVVSSEGIPRDIQAEYPGLLQTLEQSARTQVQAIVQEHFRGPDGLVPVCEVAVGSPLAELLRRVKKQMPDLIVVGKRSDLNESGNIPEKLARKAHCSVLTVPEGSDTKITRVLAPIDFSPNSVDTLEMAVAFASASPGATVTCLHVYRVPMGFYETGKTFDEFADIMRTHAERCYENLIKKVDSKGVPVHAALMLGKSVSSTIKEVLQNSQADLLVIGARGRSDVSAVLLGSVTERLIRSTSVPLLAVKQKGAGFSVLDALLEL